MFPDKRSNGALVGKVKNRERRKRRKMKGDIRGKSDRYGMGEGGNRGRGIRGKGESSEMARREER